MNSHHHAGLIAFQLGTPDLALEQWTMDRLRKRDVDPYLDTLYSAFEMIESGITTIQHLHNRASGPLAATPRNPEPYPTTQPGAPCNPAITDRFPTRRSTAARN